MLPTTKTKAQKDLASSTILIYGGKKIGKSTLCSEFPDAIFLATEPGLKGLETYNVPITNWQDLLTNAAELAEGKHSYKTIIIDTIDNAHRFCSEYIYQQNKIKHESDLGFGKGWKLVENEFFRVLTRLAQLPYGLVFISHSKIVEMETSHKYNKVVPALSDSAREIALGLVDVILYAEIEHIKNADGTFTENRVLRTKATKHYEAGDRFKQLPDTLELSFTALSSAWKGQ
jgi:hypothetical protein